MYLYTVYVLNVHKKHVHKSDTYQTMYVYTVCSMRQHPQRRVEGSHDGSASDCTLILEYPKLVQRGSELHIGSQKNDANSQ